MMPLIQFFLPIKTRHIEKKLMLFLTLNIRTVSSTGEGRDKGAFWAHINDRSRHWSSQLPCFTNTRWQEVEASSRPDSLQRTMAGSWWAIKSLQPMQEKPSREQTRPTLQLRISRLSLTQRRRAMVLLGGGQPSSHDPPFPQSSSRPSKSLRSVSSWRAIMNNALQRVDKDAPLPEGQPWRKQQQAMLQTAKRKANRTKKKVVSTTMTEAQPKEKKVATTTHKRKRKGKERVPLEEQEDAKNNNIEEEMKPFDGKCKKIRIFPHRTQKDLLKRWFGTARWTYNACNAAVRAGLCSHSVQELRARFLDQQAFGKPPRRRRGRASKNDSEEEGSSSRKKKRKKVVGPLSEEEKQLWQETLGPTGHMPCKATQWVLDTPTDIRDKAIKELCQAYQNGLKAHGTRAGFEVKFKSPKRLSQQNVTINTRDWNRVSSNNSARQSIYCQLFDRGKAMCASEPLPKVMEREFEVVRNQLGQYYLCIPTDLEVRGEEQAPPFGDENLGAECVFIDPGVRTFATCFDLQGRVHEFGGSGSIKRIEHLCGHLDRLISRTQAKRQDDKKKFLLGKKKRWRMRRAALRMRRRIRNLIDEMHRKVALWLCENYRVILWPISNMKSMTWKGKERKKKKENDKKKEEKGKSSTVHVTSTTCHSAYSSSSSSLHEGELVCENQTRKEQLKEYKRKLSKKSVRSMLTWGWYRFQQWLKHKVREFPWCRLVLVSEAYTTRTCTHCGTVNNYVDRDRTFRCANSHCANRRADRDHHGARNIGLRFLTEWASMTAPQSLQPPPLSTLSSSGRVVIDLTREED